MKLIMPNNQRLFLPDHIPLEEKIEIVNGILKEWEDYFRLAWHSPKTKFCLHSLGSYLCWGYHRDKNRAENSRIEDKYVWSKKKEKRVEYGDGITFNFSDLSMEDKITLGVPHCYNDEETEENQK